MISEVDPCIENIDLSDIDVSREYCIWSRSWFTLGTNILYQKVKWKMENGISARCSSPAVLKLFSISANYTEKPGIWWPTVITISCFRNKLSCCACANGLVLLSKMLVWSPYTVCRLPASFWLLPFEAFQCNVLSGCESLTDSLIKYRNTNKEDQMANTTMKSNASWTSSKTGYPGSCWSW